MEFFNNLQRKVSVSQLLPENKSGGNKLVVENAPYYWERYMWVRDYQARPGEYDNAPRCSDPENFHKYQL
jgi:hypothetical protein